MLWIGIIDGTFARRYVLATRGFLLVIDGIHGTPGLPTRCHQQTRLPK